jgi:exodeoxyribonuclease-3
MKLASWNVNSLRAREARVAAWLASRAPDIACLQELKLEEKDLPRALFEHAGYHLVGAFQKTYNGVAIIARRPLTDVEVGLGDGVDDPQARLVAATVDGLRVISAYVPNGQAVGSEKYAYKLRWLERLRAYLDRRHRPTDALVVCGDFNVAPEARDVHDPAAWAKETLFHIDSRAALETARAFGLWDTFRLHHDEAGAYSWWDYRMLGFPKDLGLRIDQIYATRSVAERCVAASIERDERKGEGPSDHAPIWAELTDG